MLEDVHIVGETDARGAGEFEGLGADEIVPAAPGVAAGGHEGEVGVKVAEVFRGLEGAQNC